MITLAGLLERNTSSDLYFDKKKTKLCIYFAEDIQFGANIECQLTTSFEHGTSYF